MVVSWLWRLRCSKTTELEKHGYAPHEVEQIYQYQFAGCGTPFAPCFICNRDGKSKCTEEDCSSIPMFWYEFRLPDEERGTNDNDSISGDEDDDDEKDEEEGFNEGATKNREVNALDELVDDEDEEQPTIRPSYIVPDFAIIPRPIFCKCCDEGWWRPGWGNQYELIALSNSWIFSKTMQRDS